MINFYTNCHILRKAGFRIAHTKHLLDDRTSIVWLENGLKVHIYKDEQHVFVRGKSTRENWVALHRIKRVLAPVTFFFD